ncbi:MAG: amidohydrolase family protein [Fimbriimonadaceae bacterium]|nr:amidohydrolase family protein [Fimbriimonadaceae bacterium]
MGTLLSEFIATGPLADTHEHLRPEADWLAGGDILTDLFDNYAPADLLAAGATPTAIAALLDPAQPDIAARFAAVEPAWQQIQQTGYGEAVRLIAERCFELPVLTPAALAAAAPRAAALRRPAERWRLLHDVAGLDHVQTDHFGWSCPPDPTAPEFFFHDLSFASFADGNVDLAALQAATAVSVANLDQLRDAIAALFAQQAPTAIAVKSQHAYSRTLAWEERADAAVAPLLARRLAGEALALPDRLALGDWCLARGVEQCIAHHLPLKLHTGYWAGNDRMALDGTRPAHLCGLLARYPAARFVLLHASWPYPQELLALAKHYSNVWADCCWAWSLNPPAVARFVREWLHCAPVSKLLIYGGDTRWPTGVVGYTAQCRRWLARTLEAAVADGDLTTTAAQTVAERVMLQNQHKLFDLPAKRAAACQALGEPPAAAGR